MVTGPGNIYVTAAKRLLRGLIGIDSEAGTTEIAILADDTADPVHVAADLISQAEHDPLAASVLVTTSEALADAVDAELRAPGAGDQAHRADPHGAHRPAVRRRPGRATSTTGSRSSTPTPPSTWRSRPRTRPPSPRGSATPGAIFVGPWSPVSLGDYCAGSNHVLPTGGCARHSGGLSRADVPARHPRRRLHRGGAARGGRPGASRSPTPRTCPRTARRHGATVPGQCRRDRHGAAESTRRGHASTQLPLRDDLRGKTPVRRPAARRRRCG